MEAKGVSFSTSPYCHSQQTLYGVTLNEMMTTKYVVGTLISAVVFAILLLLFELWRNRKKK